MVNSELEERIEFIVEQQAQFSVGIQQLQEAQANADKRMTRLEGIMVRFYEDPGAKINALIVAQMRTDQKLAATDDRLNVFINVVERSLATVEINRKPPQDPVSGSRLFRRQQVNYGLKVLPV